MINLKKNLINSLCGLVAAWSDKSFRSEVCLGLVLLPLILIIDAALLKKIALLITYVLVLVVELLNTAIEKLCDRVTLERDSVIKSIKDMASAAVFLLLVLLFAQCIGLLIGLQKT